MYIGVSGIVITKTFGASRACYTITSNVLKLLLILSLLSLDLQLNLSQPTFCIVKKTFNDTSSLHHRQFPNMS